jgi:hypothetical protein
MYVYVRTPLTQSAHLVFGRPGSFVRVRTSSHESNSCENAFNARASLLGAARVSVQYHGTAPQSAICDFAFCDLTIISKVIE